MPDIHDLRDTIIPRSDQLNSEQLLGGPMIITVTEVRTGGGEEQPVSVYHDTDPARPYKPCKTMRKVLILAWGPDGTKWAGKSMELYNDPSVKFGGEAVGGIRIARLSDIPKDIKVSLTATKGRKAMHEIGLLKQLPELVKTLTAIGAAVDNATLKTARTLAEALTAERDITLARAAYAKKVAELKAKGSKPVTPVIPEDDLPDVGADGDEQELTEDQVAKNLRSAQTIEVLDMAREQIEAVKSDAARGRLTQFADERAHELQQPA